MKLRRTWAFTRKECIEILRDPVTVGVAILMPLVMLFLFGYALSFDVKDAPLAVVDQDKSVASRSLSDQFLNSGYFKLIAAPDDERTAEHELMSGRAPAMLFIPASFNQRLRRNAASPVEFVVDGTYASNAAIISAYGRAILYAFPKGSLEMPVQPEVRVWYNPQLRTRDFLIPGLFAVILMSFPPLLTALAVAREKELGTIAQIYASPLTKSEFIVGKLLPYFLIAALELAMVLVAGFLWFDVPMHGSLALLVGLGVIYVLCTVAIGLLISTLVKTQLAAMLLALILTLMPSFLFSGLVYPVATMPEAFQMYSAQLPTMYFVDISRGIVMRGAGLKDVLREAGILVAYTGVVLAAAVLLFRKRIA